MNKPLYVVNIRYINSEDGYYSANSPYRPVTIEQADKLTHKDAEIVRKKMIRAGYKQTKIEPIKS